MEEEIRVRMPKQGEVIGVVQSLLGANRMRVLCQDDKLRICRIPGSKRKRMWVRENYVVLVRPWEIQGDTNGDIIWVYNPTQAGWLRKKGILKIR